MLTLGLRGSALKFSAAVGAGSAQLENLNPGCWSFILEAVQAIVALATAGERMPNLHGRLALAPMIGFGDL